MISAGGVSETLSCVVGDEHWLMGLGDASLRLKVDGDSFLFSAGVTSFVSEVVEASSLLVVADAS